ncbi:MAG TPA: hypothetical protein PKZ24_01790 [Nitrospirales bacterium]|nr:hypothetical protein [Nitrospirales bacterium]
MERRVTSHTEEEEMNQRRRLLTLARKGDQKAVEQLFELYQVKVFSGDSLKRKKLPAFPLQKPTHVVPKGSYAPEKKEEKVSAKGLALAKNQKKSGTLKGEELKRPIQGGKVVPFKGAIQKLEKGKTGEKTQAKSAGMTGKPKMSSRSDGKSTVSKPSKPKIMKSGPAKKIKTSKKPTKKK